jgi:hypothetical protein
MSRSARLIACLLLLSLAASQSTFTCTNSVVPGIASGIVRLGVPTAPVAQTTFRQPLTDFNLGTYAEVFAAFAIAGLQASSAEQYYSLVVDQILFNNGNTEMNFTMDYNNPTGTFTTTWSTIKLSWIAISTSFETVNAQSYGNYLWAGSVGITSPSGVSESQILNSVWNRVPVSATTDARCGYINTSPPYFDLYCGPPVVGGNSPVFVTHLYIMGFKFNPTGTYELAASVLRRGGTVSDPADIDEGLVTADFSQNQVPLTTPSSLPLTGPRMVVSNIGSQLQYVKVGIVITIILDRNNYPTANPAGFQYAGVYMNYTLYNTAQPIIKGTAVGNENYNYYSLLSARYQIYGLSSFFIAQLPANVTVVNYELTLPGASTVLFQTDNVNYMSVVRVSADQWSANPNRICNPSVTEMRNIVEKYLSTVPVMQNALQNIYETSSLLDFNYFARGSYQAEATAPLSANVIFTNILYFEQITVGAPYELDFTLILGAAPAVLAVPAGAASTVVSVQYSIKVEGNQIISALVEVDTATGIIVGTVADTKVGLLLGYVFSVVNPTVEISITLPRQRSDTLAYDGSIDSTVATSLVLRLYSLAYNPSTDCCDTTCPVNSGLQLAPVGSSIPPSCVVCANGLFYNAVTRVCQCQTGYYSVTQVATGQVACFPCFAPLCQSCTNLTRDVCTSCVTGAAVNATTGLCQCVTGFWQNSSTCGTCPIRCASCNVGTVCLTCSDTVTRDTNKDCACLTGFYEAGSAVCAACPSLCQTCVSSTECTSCFTQNNRALSNGQCVCAAGFFQVVQPNGTLVCLPCDASCTTCSLTADHCTNCEAANNRILGYDSTGAQVCNCISGYSTNSQGQCVQSNCTADPYCSTCLTVLGVSQCIKCIAATMRVLVLPQQRCLCQDGFYDFQGICTPCASGCSKCSSATNCSTCVVSAAATNNGACACPAGYFFTTSPIRYCKSCANYTLTCLSLTQALTCVTNFTLTNGACACSPGRYINALGQCQPCITGCSACSSSLTCDACQTPLLLQSNTCVSRCGPGYFQNGFVCTACSPGCASCQGANICLICLSGQLSYNGFCYKSCPPGSVKGNNSNCLDCNSPCKTCTEHPSKCTSCQSCCGNFFNYQCLESCPVGTYSVNGSCQYCAYSCKTCVGSNITCTACPDGKVLFNGACYDQCPYVMIGGICTFNCANGLYKTAMNTCQSCDVKCLTCDSNAANCTACKTGYGYALNGVCVQTCPTNYLSIDGQCKPCNAECKGCLGSCSSCVDCAAGYYKLGSTCVKTCYPNMFVDGSSSICVTCNDKCKTCSSLSFCTTCANPQAVPVNGVCNDCSYPCNTCSSAPSACTSCVSGFNLIGTTCIAACPAGAYAKNGVCQCNVGAIYSNQCVSQCPTGYGNVGGQCLQCATNCAACDGSKTLCTSCLNGYALDQVSGLCQQAPSCQFGQYFSQSSNACTRICPANTYFYENVCLTACLSGYNDNGVGGCVAATPQTGCSFPYFLSNGVCVSNCPSGSYPDTQNRLCKACSSNCFSCLTNTFCYACNAGYDLSNGICIAATLNCPAGQFRYNGVCYSACPAGTCQQGSFCQRTCPAGTWSYNKGCYRTCPTAYTTTDACVSSCPANTALVGTVCQVGSRACPSGQYWDGTASACRNCQYPCAECSLTASYCTACSTGLTLNQNLCVSTSNSCGKGRFQSTSGGCQACADKCSDCISASICSSCASGYNFNGNDCVKATGQLSSISLNIKSVSKRGNTAFATVCPNIIPNGLSPQQQNNFFSVIPAAADKANVAYINQWLSTIDNGCVTVGINYNSFPTSSAAYIAVNSQLLGSSYMSIGYLADSSSFVSVAVNINLPTAPDSLIPPANSAATRATQSGQIPLAARSGLPADILA